MHYMQSADGFLDLFDSVVSRAAREQFFVGGRLNLLDFSEKHDSVDLQTLYSLLDHNDQLSHLLDSNVSDDGE